MANENLQAAMIEAMKQSLGVVTTAAKVAGISRQAHYDWMATDPEYKKAIEDTAEVALDYAESQLHKQIGNGEVASTIFYLKTKGKKRGYVERNEVELSGSTVPIQIIFPADDPDPGTTNPG